MNISEYIINKLSSRAQLFNIGKSAKDFILVNTVYGI